MNIPFRVRKNELIREWQNCGVEYAVGNDTQRAAAKQKAQELLVAIDEMTRLEKMVERADIDMTVWGEVSK